MDDTLLGHLAALRRAILRAAAGVALLLVPGFLAAPLAIRALVRLAVPESLGELHYFAPLEAFRAQLHVGFVLATAAAWPWVAAQAWGFVRPGLREDEARALRRWIPLSTVLFLGGALFACAAAMPLVMAFSASFEGPGLAPLIGLGHFLGLAGSLALGFGLMAQTPLVLALAARLGLASAAGLRRGRPWAVLAILSLSALLTPPDVASQLLLALPTLLLYELGIRLAARAPSAPSSQGPTRSAGSPMTFEKEPEKDSTTRPPSVAMS